MLTKAEKKELRKKRAKLMFRPDWDKSYETQVEVRKITALLTNEKYRDPSDFGKPKYNPQEDDIRLAVAFAKEYENNLSIQTIAAKYHVGTTRVIHLLENAGIKRRSPGKTVKEPSTKYYVFTIGIKKEIKDLYIKGWTQAQIRSKYRTTYENIASILEETDAFTEKKLADTAAKMEIENRVCDEYLNGATIDDLSLKYKVSAYRVLSKNNIPRRRRGAARK